MLGLIIFDASQRVPIYWSTHMAREFVDGVLDVILADRASQFSYVVGPPSLYRGNAQDAETSLEHGNNSEFGDGAANHNSNHNNAGGSPSSNSISKALLHSSLLCGVVESQHKVHASAGLMRPPHWPKLIRTGGTGLGRAAIAPSCPGVSRVAQNLAPAQLTQRQILASRSLNEGCVSLSTHSPHAWLHPQVAPVATEDVAQWVLSYEQRNSDQQEEMAKVRVAHQTQQAMTSNANLVDMVMGEEQRYDDDGDGSGVSRANKPSATNSKEGGSSGHNNKKKNNTDARSLLPAMYHFPWRVFGESLGVVYALKSAAPSFSSPSSSSDSGITKNGDGGNPNKNSSSHNNNNNDHDESLQAAKQSIGNLFVVLCEAFKTARSAEAPSCKNLTMSLDLVHEVCEVVCPGNGRCMPLYDTAMARKIWKTRSES